MSAIIDILKEEQGEMRITRNMVYIDGFYAGLCNEVILNFYRQLQEKDKFIQEIIKQNHHLRKYANEKEDEALTLRMEDKEHKDKEDVYKKCWETLKSIYRSKEDMCVEKVYTENLLEDFDMLELEFGIRED